MTESFQDNIMYSLGSLDVTQDCQFGVLIPHLLEENLVPSEKYFRCNSQFWLGSLMCVLRVLVNIS